MRPPYNPGQPAVVIGIDPGPATSGLVIWTRDWVGRPIAAWERAIELDSAVRRVRQMAEIYPRIEILVAIEWLTSYGAIVGETTFETAAVVGELRRACKDLGIDYVLPTRPQVALMLCQTTRAKDTHLTAAAKEFFNPYGGGSDPYKGVKAKRGPLYGCGGPHAWSALHVACAAVAEMTDPREEWRRG